MNIKLLRGIQSVANNGKRILTMLGRSVVANGQLSISMAKALRTMARLSLES